MAEFGILLRGDLLCPAATFQAAVDQAAALGRPLVVRGPYGWQQWITEGLPVTWAPTWPAWAGVRVHAGPSHNTIKYHRVRREAWCVPCRRWWAGYARAAYARDREQVRPYTYRRERAA